MNIKKNNQNHWEIKTKTTKIIFNGNLSIRDFVIPGPGEYEIEEVEVEAFDGIYLLYLEKISIVIIAKDKKIFDEKELKTISESDVLFISIEGENTLNTKEALKLISNVEPKIIIPTYYTNLNELVKTEGIKIINTKEYKIDKSVLETEERQFVILEQ